MLQLVKNYKQNSDIRKAFFEFTPKALWGINFKPWAEKGYWDSLSYDGYALMKDDKMMANVSFTKMKILIDDQERTLLQLGTVGTLEEERGKGYSRLLLEEVLKDWEKRVDWIFLFANENVLSFYPKFGFEQFNEGIYTFPLPKPDSITSFSFKKVCFPEQEQWFWDKVQNRQPVSSRFAPRDGHEIMMLYIYLGYGEHVWYEEKKDSVVMMEEKEGTLHLYDWIFSGQHNNLYSLLKDIPFEAKDCIVYFMDDNVKKIGSYKNQSHMFFIRSGKEEKESFPREIVFPILYKT
ncbi:GNAT family N-acetyltransferase [Rossellomorea aquimaris]|uniref:GNAT family N-acetyltransferase n=1 Tax=Rossellomorea aquimaris TaxID=189382 RepID=UPI0007D05987|nr:GNAT family N-acetyltransferase [Rossellomorea aquimaris]